MPLQSFNSKKNVHVRIVINPIADVVLIVCFNSHAGTDNTIIRIHPFSGREATSRKKLCEFVSIRVFSKIRCIYWLNGGKIVFKTRTSSHQPSAHYMHTHTHTPMHSPKNKYLTHSRNEPFIMTKIKGYNSTGWKGRQRESIHSHVICNMRAACLVNCKSPYFFGVARSADAFLNTFVHQYLNDWMGMCGTHFPWFEFLTKNVMWDMKGKNGSHLSWHSILVLVVVAAAIMLLDTRWVNDVWYVYIYANSVCYITYVGTQQR